MTTSNLAGDQDVANPPQHPSQHSSQGAETATPSTATSAGAQGDVLSFQEPPPPPPVRGSGRTTPILAAVVGIAALGGVLLALQSHGTALKDLSARIDSLERRLDTATAVTAPLPDRIAGIEKAVAGLEGRVTQAAKASSDLSGIPPVIHVMAARQLRAALSRSTPFHAELALARLAGVVDGDMAKLLDTVAPRAVEGVPTRDDLIARFALLVPAVLGSELGGGPSGVGNAMWGWVTGVTTVLRPPAEEGSGDENRPSALLARAGIMLEAGDLAGAVERIALLDGAQAEAAAPWLADARARVAADQASLLLAGRMDELLAAAKR
jgi:hypothetical protein